MSYSRRLVSVGFLVIVGVVACSQAWAQPNPEPAARAGGGNGRAGGGSGVRGVASPFALLGYDSVAKELSLTDDQKTSIKKITDTLQSSLREIFNGVRDLSAADRAAKVAELRETVQTKRQDSEKAVEALLQPAQIKRLHEIYVQARGVDALRDPAVQTELGLSDDQKKKLQSPLELLTDDQRTAFKAMQGEKFDVGSLRPAEPAAPRP